jgi:hypothetical protein
MLMYPSALADAKLAFRDVDLAFLEAIRSGDPERMAVCWAAFTIAEQRVRELGDPRAAHQ